ncbi:MAG: hypothetical protein ABSG41_09290 [Bryobacteraceae bacterium]
MGPDEFATREEVGVIAKFLLAKIQNQTVVFAELIDMLVKKGIVTDQEINQMVEKVAASPEGQFEKKALEKIRESAAIRNIAKQYLDLPSEEL